MRPEPLLAAAAVLPSRVMYQPSPGQVAIYAIADRTEGGRPFVVLNGPCAVLSPAEPDALRAAGAQLASTPGLCPPGSEWAIVGYGTAGADNARAVRAGLEAGGAPIAGETRVRHDGQIAHVPEQLRSAFPDGPVPDDDLTFDDLSEFANDYAAQLALQGRTAAASSREELLQRYRPTPEPLYPALDQHTREQILQTAPSRRRDLVLGVLEEISTPGSRVDPDRAAAAAYVIHSNGDLRDRLNLDIADDQERTEALLQLYRGADPSMRHGLGGAAAFTQYLTNSSTIAAEQIALDAPTDHMAPLVCQAGKHGMPPDELRATIAAIAATPEQLDHTWRRDQAASRVNPAFPQPASQALRAQPRAAGTAHQRGTHAHTDKGPELGR